MAYSQSGFGNPFGFTITPWVKRLLIANTVIFLVDFVAGVVGYGGIVSYLFRFTPAEILSRPWSPLTYMFVHGGFFHLFFNMLVLFFFGPPLEERWGEREFIKFYLIAGLGGALLSLLSPQTPIIGASAAVYGVMLAYAMYWPDNPIYIWGIFPIKAKWLVAIMAAISILSLGGAGSGVAHLAHLGGFASAFLYLKSPWAPSPWGGGAVTRRKKKRGWSFSWPLGGSKESGSSSPKPPQRPAPPVRAREEQELLDDVDRILEKISARGLDSLTQEERNRLDEVSRRYRSN